MQESGAVLASLSMLSTYTNAEPQRNHPSIARAASTLQFESVIPTSVRAINRINTRNP